MNVVNIYGGFLFYSIYLSMQMIWTLVGRCNTKRNKSDNKSASQQVVNIRMTPQLPTQIIAHILSFMDVLKDNISCENTICAVNRSWLNAAKLSMFHIDTDDINVKNLTRIFQTFPSITSLCLGFHDSDVERPYVEPKHYRPAIQSAERAVRMLLRNMAKKHLLRRLRSLKISPIIRPFTFNPRTTRQHLQTVIKNCSRLNRLEYSMKFHNGRLHYEDSRFRVHRKWHCEIESYMRSRDPASIIVLL